MKIDISEIVERIDINKLVEERITSDIIESSDLEDIVVDIFEDEEVESLIKRKAIDIIDEYLSSDEGKRYIIEQFEETIADSDIWNDRRIIDTIANFLKKNLMEKQ